MEPVDRLNQTLEILRRQLAERADRLDRPRAGASARSQAGAAPRSLGSLRARIVERLRSLQRDDPRRESQARRIFLESVLAWEFGEDILGDPRFSELVEQVQTAMAANADTDRKFRDLIAALAA